MVRLNCSVNCAKPGTTFGFTRHRNRDEFYLRGCFLSFGVWLGGVVNWHRHNALLRAGHIPNCSKYPPAFNIDLLVNDADGVALEGKQHGFVVLLIDPADREWAAHVRRAAGLR